MDTRNDGGPMHPTDGDWDQFRHKWNREPGLGMSLRQYYAGQALAGVMSGVYGVGTLPTEERARRFADLADVLFEIADAMIAAGEK